MKYSAIKRIMAGSLAFLLLTISGCQGGATPTAGSSSTSDKAESFQSNDSALTDDLSVKQTINIILAQHPLVKDINENNFTHWLEEELNIDLIINPIIQSEFSAKLDIMMSTGEYPEVCLSQGYSKVDLYGPDEGIMIALDEYINESNTPNLIAADEKVPGYLDSMRMLDGKIYSIGHFTETFHVAYGNKCWYYDPIFTETGLPIPTTTDEFYNTLKAIKAQNPDYIPLMGYKADYGLLFLGNSFLFLSGADLQLWNDSDTIRSAVIEDDYREALKYLNLLYKEGLLYNNAFAQTLEQAQAIANAPDAPVVGFVSSLLAQEFWPVQEEGGLYRETKALTPLKGPKGVQYAATTISPYAATRDGAFFITTKLPEEKRIRALKIMDLLATQETYTRTFGIEGEHWVYSEPNKLGIDGVTPAVFNSLTGWAPAIWGEANASWINFFPSFQTHEIRMSQEAPNDLDILSPAGTENRLYQVTKEQYEPYGAIDKRVPNIRYSVDEINQISQKKADVQKYTVDSCIEFITGSKDVNDDVVWQTYLAQLEQMGLQDVLALTQTGYDRQYKG